MVTGYSFKGIHNNGLESADILIYNYLHLVFYESFIGLTLLHGSWSAWVTVSIERNPSSSFCMSSFCVSRLSTALLSLIKARQKRSEGKLSATKTSENNPTWDPSTFTRTTISKVVTNARHNNSWEETVEAKERKDLSVNVQEELPFYDKSKSISEMLVKYLNSIRSTNYTTNA